MNQLESANRDDRCLIPLMLAVVARLSIFLNFNPATAMNPRDRNSTTRTAPTQSPANPDGPSGSSTDLDRDLVTDHRDSKFEVRAIGFTAIDESGVDFWRSGEVYSVWSSNHVTIGTLVFANIDSGDYPGLSSGPDLHISDDRTVQRWPNRRDLGLRTRWSTRSNLV